jgi:hypothetical protein
MLPPWLEAGCTPAGTVFVSGTAGVAAFAKLSHRGDDFIPANGPEVEKT